MIRNCDLGKMVPVAVIQEVLEYYFPREGTTEFKNPEGFGAHYSVDNEEIIDTDEVVEKMLARL